MNTRKLRRGIAILLTTMMLIADVPMTWLMPQDEAIIALADGAGDEGGYDILGVEPGGDPLASPPMRSVVEPTADPTAEPTADPTADPTAEPTADPTAEPTADPTAEPTADPLDPEEMPEPSEPSEGPHYTADDKYVISLNLLAMQVLATAGEPDEPIDTVIALEYQGETFEWITMNAPMYQDAYVVRVHAEPGSVVRMEIPLQGLRSDVSYRARILSVDGIAAGIMEDHGYYCDYMDTDSQSTTYIELVKISDSMSGLGIESLLESLEEGPFSLEINLTVNNNRGAIVTDTYEIDRSDPQDMVVESSHFGISYNITFAENAEEGFDYTISVVAPENYVVSPVGAITGTIGEELLASIDVSVLEMTEHTLEKIWNDNGATASRPGTVEFYLQVQKKDGDFWAWDDVPDGEIFLASGGITQTYTYSDLPRYDDEGDELAYRVCEVADSVPGYLASTETSTTGEGVGTTMIVNTITTSFRVCKYWNDVDTREHTQPDTTTWANSVTLWRVALGGLAEPLTLVPNVQVTSGNEWQVDCSGLPAYDESGQRYMYYITESDDEWQDAGEYGEYVTAPSINSGIYDGGNSISLITDSIDFTFTKAWKDGDGENRPDVTFKIYRCVKDPDAPEGWTPSIGDASPVPYMDTMVIPGTSFVGNEREITYGEGAVTSLARYDMYGREYIYFLVESMSGGSGDYVQENENGAAYIYAGSTVTNRKAAQITPSVTKIWSARAVQSMIADVTFTLQQETAPGVWEDVDDPNATLTITGFRAEMMSKTGTFPGSFPQYNDEGRPITYRVVESGATINGNPAVGSFGGPGEDGEFIADGHKFIVTYKDTGEIVNTLVGETAFQVNKTWNGWVAEEEQDAWLEIVIYQDGQVYVPGPGELPSIPGIRVELQGDGVTIRLTNENSDVNPNFSALFTGLPQYDSSGRQYQYTVAEGDCTDGYVRERVDYVLKEIDPYGQILSVEVINIRGGEGPRLEFWANKDWQDDGDLLHRETVVMGLYYNENAGTGNPASYVQVAEIGDIVIAEEDVWAKWFYYIPDVPHDAENLAPEWKYENYIIREKTVDGETVVYDSGSLGGGTGIVETKDHVYAVTHSVNDASPGRHVATNRREGKLTITVNKGWNVGDIEGLEAEFTVYANDVPVQDGIRVIKQDEPSFDIVLPKYDANGGIITYTVKETGLREGSSGSFTPFAGNSVTLNDVGEIVSNMEPGEYTVGVRRADDTMSYTFTNRRANAEHLWVNKIWRDEGPSAPRPDIRLKLTRVSAAPGAIPVLVSSDRGWNTRINDWYWKCDFGMLPRYDSNGYEYTYYVEETTQQGWSKYDISYYNGGVQPGETGASSEAIFMEHGGSGLAVAAFGDDAQGPGTVINTIVGELQMSGKKVWSQIPPWFDMGKLPTVYVTLYRMTQPEYAEAAGVYAYDDAHKVEGTRTELAGGETGFDFGTVDEYTEYGIPYVYYIQETWMDGGEEKVAPMPGYGTSYYQPTLTVTNGYIPQTIVNISAEKKWDWDKADPDQTHYPAVVFDLYQTWPVDNPTRDVVYRTLTLPGREIATYDENAAPQMPFLNLPYYAPDGTPFGYYLKERDISGYEQVDVDPAGGIVDLTWDAGEEIYTGTVTFTNEYKPVTQDKVEAIKVWKDEENKYGTRPASDTGDLIYTLWRRAGSSAAENLSTAYPGVLEAAWAESGDTWTCTFTSNDLDVLTLPEYSTTGEKYTYYVVEELAAPYNACYQQTAGGNTKRLTNTLRTVGAAVTKEWRDGNGDIIPGDQLAQMLPFGLPEELTFTLYYREKGTATWNLWDGGSVTKTEPIGNLLNGETIVLSKALPQYIEEGGRIFEVEYMAQEDTTVLASFITTTEADGALVDGYYTSTTTNSFAVRKLGFIKYWDDDTNRDGKRPASLDLTITEGGTGKEQTVTLTSAGATGGGNQWRGELVVPVETGSGDADYDVVEEDVTVAGYECTSIVKPTDDPDVECWAFTNQYGYKTITIIPAKAWDDYTKWTIRPDKVTLILEVSEDGGNTWSNVEGADSIEVTGSTALGVIEWYTNEEWENLPIGRTKDDPEEEVVVRHYRVREENEVPGYKSRSAVVIANEHQPGDEVEVFVLNTLETVDISGTKEWKDNDDHYGRQPTALALTVLGDGEALAPQPSPITWNSDLTTYTIGEALPKYKSGTTTEVIYTVEETVPPEYGVEYDGDKITNTLDTVNISGTKTWVDDSNWYDHRPDDLALEVQIKDGGNWVRMEPQPKPADIVWTKPSPATSNTWSFTITGLPKWVKDTNGGTEAEYRVVEKLDSVAIVEYTPTVEDYDSSAFENTLETVEITGTKTWDDQSDKYKTRPAVTTGIEIEVYENGVLLDPQPRPGDISWTTSGTNTWMYTIENLPKYRKDTAELAVYTVREATVPVGYDEVPVAVGVGKNLENKLQTVSLNVEKTWDDFDNYYGMRPENLGLTIYSATGGQVVPHPTVVWDKDGNEWSFRVEGLPRIDKRTGKPIEYRVSEEKLLKYDVGSERALHDEGDVTVYLENELKKVQASGSKAWEDDGDHYGRRPTDLALTVYANGNAVPAGDYNYFTIQWANKTTDTWTYTVRDLPMYSKDSLEPINYAIEETVPLGYVSDPVDGKVAGTLDQAEREVAMELLTNTLETTSITGVKSWVDDEDYYTTRPDSGTIGLVLHPKGSDTPYSPQPDDSYITWMKNGDGTWTYTIDPVPLYEKNSDTLAEYTVKEVEPNGYEQTDKGASDTDFTNELLTTKIEGEKTWSDFDDAYGLRPGDLSLEVYNKDGNLLVVPKDGVSWNRTAGPNAWTYLIEGLPKYDKTSGDEIEYEVVEVVPNGYVQGTTIDEYDFRNELDTFTIAGSKTWGDWKDFYGIRPDQGDFQVEIYLKGETSPLALPVTITWSGDQDDDTWTYLIENVPRYTKDAGGNIVLAEYDVKETVPLGYRTTQDTHTFTAPKTGVVVEKDFENALETVSITGTVQWNDFIDRYGLRPEMDTDEFVLTVYNGATALEDQPDIDWVKTSDTLWTYTINGLPRYDISSGAEVEIGYVVEQPELPGYDADTLQTSGTPDGDGNVTEANFENTLKTVELKGIKKWVDESDRFEYRPDDLPLTVYADGVALTPQPTEPGQITWTDQDTDEWAYSIADVPMYGAGSDKPIEYSVEETVPAGYTADPTNGTVAGTLDDQARIVTMEDLTNTLEYTEIEGVKTWVDESNRYGTRPDALEIVVYADGTALDPALVAPYIEWDDNGDDTWTYRVTYLPKYEKASSMDEIPYTVEEVKPVGYEQTDADDFNFTNKLWTVDIYGAKVWEDDSDYYGMRPDTLALEVYIAGESDPVDLDESDVKWTKDPLDKAKPWTYEIQGLPRYDENGEPIVYVVKEIVPGGYETAEEEITLTPDGVSTDNPVKYEDVDFANTLITVSVAGKKIWDDEGDVNGVRPGNIALIVYAGGAPLVPQPNSTDISWTKPADKTQPWEYEITGLPRYGADGKTEIVYTIQEGSGLEDTYVVVYESGYDIDTEGNITGMDITNRLINELRINNTTLNAAVPGRTNAGGFVAVGSTTPVARDQDSKERETYVYWIPDEFWQHHGRGFVHYTLHGKDQEEATIGFNLDGSDISGLRAVFPGAQISPSGIQLTLANNVVGMPRDVQVDVQFQPTLGAVNTSQATSGQVSVEGGAWSQSKTDRRVEKTVHGNASSGYIVDLSRITVGFPNTVTASSPGVVLNLAANNTFSTKINVYVAGQWETITVSGTVRINARNQYGNPTSVSVILDDLPVPLDIGICFTYETAGQGGGRPPRPGDTPKTGDDRNFMLYYILGGMGVAMMAAGVVWILHEGKKNRKRSMEG